MWMFGLYLLFGIMTWLVYDKTQEEYGEEKCTEMQMISLIILWPVHWFNWWTNREPTE